MTSETQINSLILDAGPLINQTFSSVYHLAEKFYTTPSVFAEIRDQKARQNLLLWGDNLVIRQPKPEYITAVTEFSKKTGDYSVLSSTDLHILALCYELECELNNGDWRLRKFPGQILGDKNITGTSESTTIEHSEPTAAAESTERTEVLSGNDSEQNTVSQPLAQSIPEEDDEWSVVKSRTRRYKHKAKKDSKSNVQVGQNIEELHSEESQIQPEITETLSIPSSEEPSNIEVIEHEEEEEEADWITSENLSEKIQENGGDSQEKQGKTLMKAALSSGDFAIQNVALQIGLNLVNASSGLRISKVKNYMLRCHACFKLCPIPTDGKPLHFCPRCGSNSLLRCTVSVSTSGKLQIHLKKNMQWSHRGNKFSIPTPQSRRARKVRHEDDVILLREDQKEYQKAVKDDIWKKNKNEKILGEWIGEGSADTAISPFAISGYKRDATRHSGVRVGRGKFVNQSKGKAK